MNKFQQGFTLIELMIVVAILGILAAIALPMYQDYISKSQVTRVYNEVSDLKTAVDAYLAEHPSLETVTPATTPGGAPATGAALTPEDLGWTASNLVAGKPEIKNFKVADKGAGTITATMGTNANAATSGAKVQIQRDIKGVWTCHVSGDAGTFKDKFIPAGCDKNVVS